MAEILINVVILTMILLYFVQNWSDMGSDNYQEDTKKHVLLMKWNDTFFFLENLYILKPPLDNMNFGLGCFKIVDTAAIQIFS